MNALVRRAALAGIALLAVAVPGPASAGPAHPTGTLGRPGAVATVTPAVLGSGNLVNHGGSVETTATNYLIFWGVPAAAVSVNTCSNLLGCPPIPPNVNTWDVVPYAAAIEAFFHTIGGTPFYGVLGQYGVTNASNFGGVYSDVTSPPSGEITDAAIQAEVRKAEAAQGWTGGIGHNFFVMTGPGVIPCASFGCAYTSFCGYHGTESDRTGLETPYAVIPYPEPLCDYAVTGATSYPDLQPDADSAINIISHELFETVTDPGIGWGDYGWYDAAGYEIGDKCAWIFGPSTATGGDVTLHSHPFMVQLEYSNSANNCVI